MRENYKYSILLIIFDIYTVGVISSCHIMLLLQILLHKKQLLLLKTTIDIILYLLICICICIIKHAQTCPTRPPRQGISVCVSVFISWTLSPELVEYSYIFVCMYVSLCNLQELIGMHFGRSTIVQTPLAENNKN